MGGWTRTITEGLGGRFQIVVTRVHHNNRLHGSYGQTQDVTFFRGVPTQLDSYSSADPFSDATAQLTFGQITGFDDLDSPELSWLADFSNVDIWWIPGVSADASVTGDDARPWIDPRRNDGGTALAPIRNRPPVGGIVHRGIKVFEGYIASQGIASSEDNDTTTVQCQGALFQLDRYLQKPFYPPNPQTLESLIAAVFDHTHRPHLRTHPLEIDWPAGWTKVVPRWTGSNLYTSNGTPGQKWTGYASRSTGAWDRALTGFIQDQIAAMITPADAGVTAGNQWTLSMAHENSGGRPGRTPVLRVRDRFRPVDFAYWYGTPGMATNLNRDTTQVANVMYGDGTNEDGTGWRNAFVSADGSRTDYHPLAASRQVYPIGSDNALFDSAVFAAEGYQKYGPGFNQSDATVSAGQTLQRDLDAGWAGTVTVKTDPSATMSRWQITAGMTMLLKGFRGSGETGIRLHVSQVQASPMAGQVELTVDTRYRDLLNLADALTRARDPLTPSKLLQINRNSAIIEDLQAPWDYHAGSGFVPRASKDFHAYRPTNEVFPYTDWSRKHPPFRYPHWYVRCDADSASRFHRWSGPIPILTSERGAIARSEFYACNAYGVPLQIAFHVSIYYNDATPDAMPKDGDGPSPFITNAFTTVDPTTGQPWPPVTGSGGPFFAPDSSLVICWGNATQPAGFSPGQFATARGRTGTLPTGRLTDDAPWEYDNTSHKGTDYDPNLKAGQTQDPRGLTLYAEFYAEYTEPVYFQGRLFKQFQGSG